MDMFEIQKGSKGESCLAPNLESVLWSDMALCSIDIGN